MTKKKMIRALVAGMLFPAVFLPIAYTVLFFSSPHIFLQLHSLQFVPMYIPILFGLANILYVHLSKQKPVKIKNQLLILTGLCLGLLVALLNIPTFIFGVILNLQSTAIIVLPILYALVFRFIIKSLNRLLDLR